MKRVFYDKKGESKRKNATGFSFGEHEAAAKHIADKLKSYV